MSKRANKRAMFGAQVMPNPARLSRPTLAISAIRTDGGTQPRERLDEETLIDYAARMVLDASTGFIMDPEGQKWPELVVFFDGTDNWLADGFHRFSAATRAELESFQVRREEGSQRDAILYSLGVNATHGKRRTNADKRRAIERALIDEEWRQWSDARIASLCKVSSPMVSKLRGALEARDDIPFEPVLYSADGREFERASQASITKKGSAARVGATPETSQPRSAKSFSSLKKMKDTSLDALVAYPTSASQWALLTAHAKRVLDPEHGRLIVHMPSSGDMWSAPAAFSATSPFASAHLCFVRTHNRHYAIWSQHEGYTPGTMMQTAKSLLDVKKSADVLILGTALDAW